MLLAITLQVAVTVATPANMASRITLVPVEDLWPDTTHAPRRAGPIEHLYEVVLDEAIYFERDSKRIRRAFRPVLDELAKYLMNHQELGIVDIRGHADATGPARWNRELSARRATMVIKELVRRGVPAWRLRPMAFGATIPVEEGREAKALARNRRVVFLIRK